jgi:hypothetical protein
MTSRAALFALNAFLLLGACGDDAASSGDASASLVSCIGPDRRAHPCASGMCGIACTAADGGGASSYTLSCDGNSSGGHCSSLLDPGTDHAFRNCTCP